MVQQRAHCIEYTNIHYLCHAVAQKTSEGKRHLLKEARLSKDSWQAALKVVVACIQINQGWKEVRGARIVFSWKVAAASSSMFST